MIDHLVYATPDLAATVDALGRRFGVPPSAGGQHVGLGTANFLADLGAGAYLEIVGPDPEQPEPARPRPFGMDRLTEPRLVGWAARVSDLATVVERARAAGFDPGPVRSMSRSRPDGVLLEWRLTPPGAGAADELVVPFLIEWGDTPHPAAGAASGLTLLSLTGTHPDPGRVQVTLAALGQRLTVVESPAPGLRAMLKSPAGEVMLQ